MLKLITIKPNFIRQKVTEGKERDEIGKSASALMEIVCPVCGEQSRVTSTHWFMRNMIGTTDVVCPKCGHIENISHPVIEFVDLWSKKHELVIKTDMTSAEEERLKELLSDPAIAEFVASDKNFFEKN